MEILQESSRTEIFGRKGVTSLGVKIELLTVSFGSGGSGGGSGPTVWSSWAEGTNCGAPWLPSKEGTVGGRTGRGGANVCRDTIIHRLNIWRRRYWKGIVGIKEMTGSEREEWITKGQSAVCERRLWGSYKEWLKGSQGKVEGFCGKKCQDPSAFVLL